MRACQRILRVHQQDLPTLIGWRRPLRWLAILAAIAGAVCFLGALNVARVAVVPKEAPDASPSIGAAPVESPSPTTPKP